MYRCVSSSGAKTVTFEIVKWLRNTEKYLKFNMFKPLVLLLDSPDYLVTVVTDQMLIWPIAVNVRLQTSPRTLLHLSLLDSQMSYSLRLRISG